MPKHNDTITEKVTPKNRVPPINLYNVRWFMALVLANQLYK